MPKNGRIFGEIQKEAKRKRRMIRRAAFAGSWYGVECRVSLRRYPGKASVVKERIAGRALVAYVMRRVV